MRHVISVLLWQHEMTVDGIEADFVGWKIPNHFVVGYAPSSVALLAASVARSTCGINGSNVISTEFR